MINLGPYSGKSCPNVHLQPTIIDRILEGVALIVLLALCLGIYMLYIEKGGYLSHNVWIMGGTSIFCTILMGVCAYVPVRSINFPVRVNEHNIGIQYVLAVRLIRIMNVVLNLILFSGAFMNYFQMASVFFYSWSAVLALILILYYVVAYIYR